MKSITGLSILLLLVGLSGCSSNRGIISLKMPSSPQQELVPGKEVYIRSVKDNRHFEETSRDPSVPSLKFRGTEEEVSKMQMRAVARKRNAYGRALGNVILDEGESVEGVMVDALERTFLRMGYRIVPDEKSVTDSTLILDVSIGKFWAYLDFRPADWILASEIEASLSFDGESGPEKTEQIFVKSDYVIDRDLLVQGKGIQLDGSLGFLQTNFRSLEDKYWVEIVENSLNKFSDEAMAVLAKDWSPAGEEKGRQ